MAKTRVALLLGGKSGEHEVSLVSGLSVYEALDKSKFDVTLIGIEKDGSWILPDVKKLVASARIPKGIGLKMLEKFSPWEMLNTKNFDVVFPVLHSTNGEDGTMQGFLELLDIAYVGSGVLGSSAAMDKDHAKRVFSQGGIKVVPGKVLKRGETLSVDFDYPYFIKPANLGSSVGVSKVKSAKDVKAAIDNAFLYDTKILVEKGIDARELECSILGNQQPKASVIGEIKPSHEFYSFEAKYIDTKGADVFIPAQNLDAKVVTDIQAAAINGFKLLGCAGMARVDFFMDRKTNEIYLNEINTIPGFTSISMYPKLWAASGLPYPKLLEELIRLAAERHTEKKALKTTFEA
jgi:D-alanine-D-alanine ligase